MSNSARKLKRKDHKVEMKKRNDTARVANEIWKNANTVSKLLERAKPKFAKEIRENVIREQFLILALALHDSEGFGKKKLMRVYKTICKLNYARLEEAKAHKMDDAAVFDELLKQVGEDFECDLNAEMERVNAELEKEGYKEMEDIA